jgi:hypothetical protein
MPGVQHLIESKLAPGCISLPKDEYENIGSLHLLDYACGHGFGSTASSSASRHCARADRIGDCERVVGL